MWEVISHKQVCVDTQNILRYVPIGVMKFQCHPWVIFREYVPQYFSEDGA